MFGKGSSYFLFKGNKLQKHYCTSAKENLGQKAFMFQTSDFLILLPTVLITSASLDNNNPVITIFLNWILKANCLNNYRNTSLGKKYLVLNEKHSLAAMQRTHL